ncbi:hypothetical protein ABT008_29425 [Micromonospora sp. NPDC002389]|uniref:hypothetical protein n=1 Tax=Micromonospora sp. NPDC002389 TaxID=3154272 RepID=UPI003322EAAC
MSNMEYRDDEAFLAWRDAMYRLTSGQEAARSWRRSRYTFAHRLGAALVGATEAGAAISGPVIYGVWLRWGLLYVGQTREAERRLRDLPVGESHHLANTFPPEIWHRVVVVAWPMLVEAQPLAARFGSDAVGLALEHALQGQLRPLVNSERRTSDGGWRDVMWEDSRSRGARIAHEVVELVQAVRKVWDDAACQPAGGMAAPPSCRVVFPGELLSQKAAESQRP